MALGWTLALVSPALDSPSGCASFVGRVTAVGLFQLLGLWLLVGLACFGPLWSCLNSFGNGRGNGQTCTPSNGLLRFPMQWGSLLCLLLGVRVGEASNPGPTWTLGVANLSGLHNRAYGLAESEVDSWLFSETHLTAAGEKVFRASLKEAKAPYRSFIGGFPVPPRSEASEIGQWSGVGVLSRFPVRRVPHCWPELIYRSGRLVSVSVCCHGIWISGVVIYGPPTGATHVNGREVTKELLQLALERVNDLDGPRFLAGDWNHDLDKLGIVDPLHRLGFAECQDIHAERTGSLPQPTCRGKTRHDFLFMSRELLGMFERVEVDANTVSDHASLVCHFHGGVDLLRYAWPIPDQMDWLPPDVRDPVGEPLFVPGGDMTADYQRFWYLVESSNDAAKRHQQKPVVRAMAGRGVVMKPQIRTAQIPPLKASRPGDRQPAFLGSCLQHVQWTKQLRRLQSYLRLVGSSNRSPAHAAHTLQLWAAIRSARGFVPSFAEWWTSRHLCAGDPAVVPESPPAAPTASLFYLGVELELSNLEAALKKSRSHARRLRRAGDAQAIFDFVKRDVPAQVDSLVTTVSAQVVNIDEAECAVELHCPVDFNPERPLCSPAGLHQIIHGDSDKVWLDSCNGIELGHEVFQRTQIGQLEALFSAFESQWAKLWKSHESVPNSQWNDILEFARSQLRPVPPSVPPLSVDSLRRNAQRKSKFAATGLDGVSRADVLSLDSPDLTLVLKLYARASECGVWPAQMLHGYVRSLAKVPEPVGVSDYRPITVFSFLYRTWSSICARHWLRQISQVVDPFLFGSTSGGRAAMVWRHVLEAVERARSQDAEVCGFVADIVKAFNALPRVPALAAAKLLGVDQGTLVAWSGALSGFRRHFVIQGSYSPGVDSCNGFPEGCAMSCLAMVSLTHLFHRWVKACEPSFCPISYVDNWAILIQSPSAIAKACQAVDQSASLLSIKLDSKKSFTWAAQRESRAQLRASGFQVANAVRDLGAHMTYTRQLTNFTSLERIRGLSDFWQKLLCATCSFRQKVSLVLRVAWPRGLHAISAVVLGKKRFTALRTAVMQALDLARPGANPDLQCCLEDLAFDPQVYAVLETLRDARSLGKGAEVALDLDLGPLGDQTPSFNSLSEILCQRLHQTGFRLLTGTTVEDDFGVFCFLRCGFGELQFRLQRAWTRVVGSRVRHRDTFAQFSHVDVCHTRRAYKQYEGFEQGVLRKYLHGASLTNDLAQFWSETGTATCEHCGALDSASHRLWKCPFTAALREQLPGDFLHLFPTYPSVVTLHGWTLQSPLSIDWLQYLHGLPRDFVLPTHRPPSQILDLFTDGSCLSPTDPDLRVAAFSVVWSPGFRLGYSVSDFRPLVAAPLPGVLQSAFRAELQAVVVALTIAAKFQVWARVWTDCESVVKAYKKYVLDQRPINPNAKHSDLLHALKELVEVVGAEKIAVLKVPAHEQKEAYSNELEQWLVEGNAVADKAAGAANLCRGAEVWALWQAFAAQLADNRYVADLVRDHMVAVGRLWASSHDGGVRPSTPGLMRPPKPSRVQPQLKWSSPAQLVLRGKGFHKLFDLQLAREVRDWISSIRNSAAPLRWISYLHLFISFQWAKGPIAVAKHDGKWSIARGQGARLANQVRLATRTKWFRLMIQQFLKDCHVSFSTATIRPFSQWVCCFRGCIGFQMDEEEFPKVELFLQHQLGSPATGTGRALDLVRGV